MRSPSKIHDRGAKQMLHKFVNQEGKKHVTSVGGNMDTMIVFGDFSRYAWMCFVSQKYDAAYAFEKIFS